MIGWRRLGLLSEIVLPLLTALFEAAWIALWIGLLSEVPDFAAHQPLLHGPTVFGLLLVVSFATRLILKNDWPLWKARLAIVETAAMAVLLTAVAEYANFARLTRITEAPVAAAYELTRFSPLLVALLLSALLAWWGVRLGRSRLQFDDVYGHFLLGLFALLVLLVISSITGREAAFAGGAVPAALVFFSAGLVSLSLARIAEVQEEARLQRDQALLLDRRWLAALLGLVGLLLLVTVLLSTIVSLSALRALLTPAGDFLSWISGGLYYLFLPLGFAVALLVYAGRWLIALLGAQPPPQPPQPDDVEKTLRDVQHGHALGVPPEFALALKGSVLAVVAAVVLVLLARSVVRYWRRPEQEGAVELHESVFDAAEFWAGLRTFFLRLFSRWRRRRAGETPALPVDLGFEASPPSIRNVRAVYRSLLAAMARRGLPRPLDQTPYGYRRNLTEHLGEHLRAGVVELDTITEAYVRARYGDQQVSDAELRRIQTAWAELDARFSSQRDDEPAGI